MDVGGGGGGGGGGGIISAFMYHMCGAYIYIYINCPLPSHTYACPCSHSLIKQHDKASHWEFKGLHARGCNLNGETCVLNKEHFLVFLGFLVRWVSIFLVSHISILLGRLLFLLLFIFAVVWLLPVHISLIFCGWVHAAAPAVHQWFIYDR